MKLVAHIVFFCMLMLMPALASENGQFMLHDQSVLGRVFLSPVERWHLDQSRLSAPPTANSASGTGTGPNPDKKQISRNAMGYIIPHIGKPLAWRDGEFRTMNKDRDLAALGFPGDIKITRHVNASADSKSTDVDRPLDDEDAVTDTSLSSVHTAESGNVQDE